jgi:hypothetical protein
MFQQFIFTFYGTYCTILYINITVCSGTRNSVVGIVTRLRLDSGKGQEHFRFSKMSWKLLRPTQPHIQWEPEVPLPCGKPSDVCSWPPTFILCQCEEWVEITFTPPIHIRDLHCCCLYTNEMHSMNFVDNTVVNKASVLMYCPTWRLKPPTVLPQSALETMSLCMPTTHELAVITVGFVVPYFHNVNLLVTTWVHQHSNYG